MRFRTLLTAGALLSAGAGPAVAQPPVRAASPTPRAYRAFIESRWPAAADAPVTPAQVGAMIGRYGPRRTVQLLWADGRAHSRWNTVTGGIAHGNAAWLAVAARISPGTDAGSSDDFGAAVQDAVVTNATGALRLLRLLPMGAGGCDENGFETPPEQATAYYAAAIASVEAVTDPGLASIKAQCLASLHTGQAALAAPHAQ